MAQSPSSWLQARQGTHHDIRQLSTISRSDASSLLACCMAEHNTLAGACAVYVPAHQLSSAHHTLHVDVLGSAGALQDATDEFEAIHSSKAKKQLMDFVIGKLGESNSAAPTQKIQAESDKVGPAA